MTLPPVRRLVASHTSTGKPYVQDSQVTIHPLPNGLLAGFPFIQHGLVNVDPLTQVGNADLKPDGFVQSGGLTVKVIDIPAGKQTAMHYTHTIDYIVIMAGRLRYAYHDGTSYEVGAGDIVVQLGNIHQWINEGAEDARMYGFQIPTLPLLVGGLGGKDLGEALGAHRLDLPKPGLA